MTLRKLLKSFPFSTMRRPSDLIFACLLRSTAALALDSSNKAESAIALGNGYISLRAARRTDVPSISRVNLATLPENYHHQFYVNHMQQWPDLAIVAEHITSKDCDDSEGNLEPSTSWKIRNPFSGHDPTVNGKSGNKIIAYVLGKVEENNISPSGYRSDECLGHVTSLAVSHEYRRHNIASELMKQLHHNMSTCHKASQIGLHVRMSNKAATRLYCDKMSYEVADIIKEYYQDGEDAFLMKRKLSQSDRIQ